MKQILQIEDTRRARMLEFLERVANVQEYHFDFVLKMRCIASTQRLESEGSEYVLGLLEELKQAAIRKIDNTKAEIMLDS